MDTVTNKFNQLWDDFVSSFKGNLIAQARKQTLSFAFVKLIFSEACLSWTSEYSAKGGSLEEILRCGVAGGTAAVTTPDSITFKREKYEEILNGLETVEL